VANGSETMTRRLVALVASPGEPRTALANYLSGAGFSVYPCENIATSTSSVAALVAIESDGATDHLINMVRSWLKLTKIPRVVVVTSKPTALHKLVSSYHGRLCVLPAPVFGWIVVDALRASDAPHDVDA